MKKVPPILLNPEGVSWLSSQIGRPINKYVRDGLDVKGERRYGWLRRLI
ncbi:hypothetical protein LINPERPRIM_LOCUS27246, partial [Linum perenne]